MYKEKNLEQENNSFAYSGAFKGPTVKLFHAAPAGEGGQRALFSLRHSLRLGMTQCSGDFLITQ